ncbi:hypothetical protein [Paenibacillus shenyangensis]|uniref:hypothetical protein n=1 Tax=Paenibacillus sp. A9 TaxID=1284352 RepID=UPI00035C41B7|nr:hypothetical protein [Paenibacillus sp. A9]
MKMMKLIGLCMLLLIVSGCSQIVSPGDLLHAPNRTNEEQTLFKAVQPFLPAGYRLTIPASYDQGSAIRLADLDGDGQQELIAFYKKSQLDYEINVLILHQQNGIWEQADLITHSGLNIDYVGILPVASQKSPYLLLGFAGGGNGLPKELYVYSYSNFKASQVFNRTYDLIAVGDMDGSGLSQIALVPPFENVTNSQNPAELNSQILLFGSQDSKIIKLASRNVDGMVTSMQMRRAAANNRTGLFLSIPAGTHSSYTALLVWDKHTLANVLTSSGSVSGAIAERKPLPLSKPDDSTAPVHMDKVSATEYPTESKDVNRDGITETVLLTVPPGTGNMPPLVIPYISTYYQWDGDRHLTFIQDRFEQWGYDFRIPDRWLGQYRIQLSDNAVNAQNEIRFIYPKSGQPTADLLVLRQIPQSDWKILEEKLKKQKEAYVVLKHISAAMTGTTPQVSVALLPNHSSHLTGEALQQYKKLRLNVSEVLLLAGNNGVIPGKEAQ